jgi:excisionase family DNA binding protein
MARVEPVMPVRGRLLSFREACTYLGMAEQRLRRLVARKKIAVIRDGRLGFYERDLDDWIESHLTPASGPSPAVVLLKPGRVNLDAPTGIDDILREIRRRRPSPFDYS